VVFEFQQAFECCLALCIEISFVAFPKSIENQIQFQQGASAMPFQAIDTRFAIFFHGQTARLTIISLILPIALVGFSPLGQTSTQFMMVWQRNRR